jgi:hypothetical protein
MSLDIPSYRTSEGERILADLATNPDGFAGIVGKPPVHFSHIATNRPSGFVNTAARVYQLSWNSGLIRRCLSPSVAPRVTSIESWR